MEGLKEFIELVETIVIENTIEIISLIIALFSAAFTFSQSRTAKKELMLQEKMYKNGQANLNIEILDNFIFNDYDREKVYFFFRVVISNLSDKATAIQTYSLYLICKELTCNLKNINKSIEPYSDFSCLNIAQNIDAHNSVCGWCVFELPRESYSQMDINTYQVEIKDIHDNIVQRESILLREELAGYEV